MPRDTVVKFCGEPLTAREVLIAREAHAAGWRDREDLCPMTRPAERERHREVEASRRYPLPKITRPRVVKDSYNWSWKSEGGNLFFSTPRSGWYFTEGSPLQVLVTAERVALWADLIARPTEEVEADA